MIIKTFNFNFIQVNTYVLYDETNEAIILDPGMSSASEDAALEDFIKKEGLKVKYIVDTHPHIDHVAGNGFCRRTFNAELLMHKAGMPIYHNSVEYGAGFNFHPTDYPEPDRYIEEGDTIEFGRQALEVVYTPGHADGSICLIDRKNNLVFTGDVLFDHSIGRSDLPTGNLDLLLNSIKTKLLVLHDDMLVYPGHEGTTTIGREKRENPYL